MSKSARLTTNLYTDLSDNSPLITVSTFMKARGGGTSFLLTTSMTSFARQMLTEVRERFFAHLNKTWKITDEGTLDRFAGVHFERSEAKRTWKASVGGYIDRVAQRFDVLDAKLADTPNGS